MNAFDRARFLATEQIRRMAGRVKSNRDRTLVIVDMQSGFMGTSGNEHDVVAPICTLIRHAQSHNWGIIVVEFDDQGDTDDQILDALTGYEYWTTVTKDDMDGSTEVLGAINSFPKWSTDFVVCGIYGPECVAATVDGILSKCLLSEVDVVEDAVYPDYCPYSPVDESDEDDYLLRAREVSLHDVVGCDPITVPMPVYPVCEGDEI